MEALEMNPQRMRGVGEPSVSQRVAGQQIAELIMPAWLGNTQQRDKNNARSQHEETDQNNGKSLAMSYLEKESFERAVSACPIAPCQDQYYDRDRHGQFDDLQQSRRKARIDS